MVTILTHCIQQFVICIRNKVLFYWKAGPKHAQKNISDRCER